ncbi:MAG TPA: cysteine desulfurase [Longimicrobiales bacterium]|nr:cysteine desulfurase [Longimicrobiales bacterium]
MNAHAAAAAATPGAPPAPTLDPRAIHEDFPGLDQTAHGKPLVYLDTAATAQRPRRVLDAVIGYYERDNANVHRGIYELSIRSTDRFEAARATIARFLGASQPAEIVFVRGTTEGINLVASAWGGANVGEGDEIVLSTLEHHSDIVPWQILANRVGARIRWIGIDEQGRIRLDHLDELLSERTRIVCVNHISNALGTINPVAEIAERAHAAGAKVMVDGAQGAPHLDVDVEALGCDFYAVSSHKMGGPMGAGALWAPRELLEEMPPYQGGGEMISIVGPDSSTWAEVPHKFEAGTPNVAGAVGMAAAADYLDKLGHGRIAAHEKALAEYGLEALGTIEGLRMFGPSDPVERIAVFSFEIEGIHPHDIATILDAQGVAVRAGHHCAQPLMRALGVAATTRASCWVYTSTDDIDRLVDGLGVARRVFA